MERWYWKLPISFNEIKVGEQRSLSKAALKSVISWSRSSWKNHQEWRQESHWKITFPLPKWASCSVTPADVSAPAPFPESPFFSWNLVRLCRVCRPGSLPPVRSRAVVLAAPFEARPHLFCRIVGLGSKERDNSGMTDPSCPNKSKTWRKPHTWISNLCQVTFSSLTQSSWQPLSKLQASI